MKTKKLLMKVVIAFLIVFIGRTATVKADTDRTYVVSSDKTESIIHDFTSLWYDVP